MTPCRCVTGSGGDSLARDASVWDWVFPEKERGESSAVAEEFVRPHRLLLQRYSEGETANPQLDTRLRDIPDIATVRKLPEVVAEIFTWLVRCNTHTNADE